MSYNSKDAETHIDEARRAARQGEIDPAGNALANAQIATAINLGRIANALESRTYGIFSPTSRHPKRAHPDNMTMKERSRERGRS